jgi:hypothetical protein
VDFQSKAGLGIEDAEAPLQFLDLLGVPRSGLYRGMMECVRGRLEEEISRLDEAGLESLLTASFPYISTQEMRSVPIKAITMMQRVPDRILDNLTRMQHAEPAVFDSLGLPLQVKRLAWERSRKVFGTVIGPHLEGYFAAKDMHSLEDAALQVHICKGFPTNVRRDKFGASLAGLAECVGSSATLTGFVCDIVGARMASVPPPPSSVDPSLWGTLLCDALVSIRDSSREAMGVMDRLCVLARFCDVRVKNGDFDERHLRELQRLVREALQMPKGPEAAAAAASASTAADAGRRVQEIQLRALQGLRQADRGRIFAVPVTEDIAPDYLKIIKSPRDFSTIKKKIESGRYRSFGDFEADVRLTFDNACRYNPPGSAVYKEARRLWNWWKQNREGLLSEESERATAGQKRKKSDPPAQNALEPPPGGLLPLPPGKQASSTAGAVALLLSEPFFSKALHRRLATCLEECAAQRCLPKDHSSLAALLQLIIMGEQAAVMYRSKSFEVPTVDAKLLREHVPKLLLLHLQMTFTPSSSSDSLLVMKSWKPALREMPSAVRVICTNLCLALEQGSGMKLSWLVPLVAFAIKLSGVGPLPAFFWRTLAVAFRKGKGKITSEMSKSISGLFLAGAAAEGVAPAVATEQLLRLISKPAHCGRNGNDGGGWSEETIWDMLRVVQGSIGEAAPENIRARYNEVLAAYPEWAKRLSTVEQNAPTTTSSTTGAPRVQQDEELLQPAEQAAS